MQLVVVQIDTVWEDRGANHEKVRSLLAASPVEPGALVVLPEMFDTGFTMHARVATQGEQRESEAFLRRLSRELDVAVLAGVIGQWCGECASNEAVAFAPDGSELVRYRKQQPFSPMGEQRLYGAGNRHHLFSWAGVLISPFICYDLRFPEIFGLESEVNGPAAFGMAELILSGFVRIVTSPKIFADPTPLDLALTEAKQLLGRPNCVPVRRSAENTRV